MQASGVLSSNAGARRAAFGRSGRVESRPVYVSRAVQAPEATPGAAPGQRPTRPLELHMGETVVSIPFSRESGTQLQAAFTALLQTFATKAKAERPKRWDTMDFKLKPSPETQSEGSVEFFEIFCNPNAYDNHINAKLLITLRHAGVKISTEAKLHAIKADVDAFVQQ